MDFSRIPPRVRMTGLHETIGLDAQDCAVWAGKEELGALSPYLILGLRRYVILPPQDREMFQLSP